jgi:hypothetical protein
MLDITDEGQSPLFCYQIYGGDWDAYYAAYDLHLVTFGAKAGVLEIPDKLDTQKYSTYLETVVTTLSTLDITCAPFTSIKSKRNSIVKALRILRKYAHYRFVTLSAKLKIKFGACCICTNM